MRKALQTLQLFFTDKNGKWAIIAFPNGLLLAWLLIVIIGMLVNDEALKNSLGRLNNAVIFVWAYLELTTGVSYFRRVLGGFILLVITIGYFI